MDNVRESRSINFIEPGLVVIAGGYFLMGGDHGQENERPVHQVWVDGFAIARYAVTNAQYGLFLDDTPGKMPPGWDDERFNDSEQPVTGVNWFDATDYCKWLRDCTGKAYRLPTEAEWEMAARGGLENKLYTWGDEPPQNQPQYAEKWQTGPERVGQRPPNGFGLFDISENVHEWCSDWYDAEYYKYSPERNPQGAASGKRRASRGGAWRHDVKISRVSARSSIPPYMKYNDYGFRCAVSV